jgi:hypothetical protein
MLSSLYVPIEHAIIYHFWPHNKCGDSGQHRPKPNLEHGTNRHHEQTHETDILQDILTNFGACVERGRSQSHVATNGQSVSPSWCRAPSAARHDQIFGTVSYVLVDVGCPL